MHMNRTTKKTCRTKN